jgi:hypothetical protein
MAALRYTESVGYTLIYPRTKGELREAARAIQAGKAQGLELNGADGYVPGGIAELAEFFSIKALRLGVVSGMSMDGIEKLKSLQHLWCGYEVQSFDLTALPHLRVLSFVANEDMDAGAALPRLRFLSVGKSRVADCRFIKLYPKLENLTLVQAARLTAVDGLSSAAGLNQLHIAHAPKLASSKGIEKCKSLASLELGVLKALTDYSAVWKTAALRRLIIQRCGALETLKTLPRLKKLEHFALIDTDVVDGDLSPVLRLPELRHFGSYKPKKHFHPNARAVAQAIAARTAERR